MTSTNRRVRIVTDTTASLPAAFIEAHGLPVIPQVILFGEESYLEDVELSYGDFIKRLKVSSQLPKTAAPPPGLFIEAFKRELEQGDTILCIHPSADVSGTVRSALTAKEEAFPGADIRIIDTRTISGSLGSIVMAAVEWAECGMGADEIVRRIEELMARSRTYFLVATLEYLYRGGRIGGAQALFGTTLQIKPILEIKDGKVGVLDRVRTEHRACERLKALVATQCRPGPESRVCVMHAADLEKAQRLASDLESALQLEHVPVYTVGAAITVHAGPGTVAVGFFA